MPSTKDILRAADAKLTTSGVNAASYKSTLEKVEEEQAAFLAARRQFVLYVPQLHELPKVLEHALKHLNGGLTELRKHEHAMKAPADAKEFKRLVAAYSERIRTAMEYHLKFGKALKEAKAALEGR